MFSILREKSNLGLEPAEDVSRTNHFVFNRAMNGPFPEATKKVMLGMGCFWGVEKLFWNISGVEMTAVGYSGGISANPSYHEVCSSKTGHNEVLLLHYNPSVLTFEKVLKTFWEGHNPTQGMRQGNDIGNQYRSGIYTYDMNDYEQALKTKIKYGNLLKSAGFKTITTEILQAKEFYFAEGYHQQYLAKNPNGYCGLAGTGVTLQS